MNKSIEIMAPAGSFDSLQAAVKGGADSVYFGVGKLNMRARAAKNFQSDDLPEIINICKTNGLRSYLAVNTILYDHEIKEMKDLCRYAKESGVTAVIVSDISAIAYAREIGLEAHISTQANISNIDAVRFYASYADVVVLARELSIDQVHSICENIKQENIRGPKGNLIQVELFVHGALCVSISGKCYMSLSLTGHSANRGDCFQTCRRSYKVTDDVTGEELVIDNKFVMSPKDICTIRFVDKLIESGASVFKIEGRGRPADYVYRVTKAYREAVESYYAGTFPEKAAVWEAELEKVFNRGFWHGGYYMGKPLEEWSRSYGSRATQQKVYAGFVKNYFPKAGVVEVTIENGSLEPGNTVMATGFTTGFAETTIKSLYVDEISVSKAEKGQNVTFPFPEKIRRNDKIYLIIDRVDFQE